MKRIITDGYDPQGRGLPQGHEGDTDEETLLLGGKQLAMAFYLAHKARPSNPNVQRALAAGYTVLMRPKNMPRDVKLEIVKHNNRNNKGVNDTLPERIVSVPLVEAAFSADLDKRQVDRASLPQKGEYTYHKLKAKFVEQSFGEVYPEFQIFKHSKTIFNSLTKFKCSASTKLRWRQQRLRRQRMASSTQC